MNVIDGRYYTECLRANRLIRCIVTGFFSDAIRRTLKGTFMLS